MERVKFDMQEMENPEISGVEYPQGELTGYEVRQYLLEKWGRKACTATRRTCLLKSSTSFRSRAADRVSNLTLAVRRATSRKTNACRRVPYERPRTAEENSRKNEGFRSRTPPVSATRWILYRKLQSLGVSLTVSSGGRTKGNRMRLDSRASAK